MTRRVIAPAHPPSEPKGTTVRAHLEKHCLGRSTVGPDLICDIKGVLARGAGNNPCPHRLPLITNHGSVASLARHGATT